jgi:hypothetical protein
MKKTLLTIIVAFSAFIAANAQVANVSTTTKLVKETARPANAVKGITEATTLTAPYASSPIINKGKLKSLRASQAANASFNVYYRNDAVLYDGVYTDGWYSYRWEFIPAFTDSYFDVYGIRNLESPEIAWSLKALDEAGSDISDNITKDENNSGILNFWGYSYVPDLAVTANGETATFHETWTSSQSGEVQAYIQAGCDSLANLTNAAPCDGVYGGFTDGPSFEANAEFNETGKKLTGFVEFFSNPGNQIYAEGIYLLTKATGANANSPIEGKTIDATIYTFDANGGLVEYASATATDANVKPVGTNGLYFFEFPFVDEDEILGKVDSPITLPQEDFVIVFTGFDELTTVYTALFNSADGFLGNGYALLEDGTFATIGYSNNPDTPQVNLHVGFLNAAIPVAELADPDLVVAIPAEGGYGVTGQTSDGEDANDIDIYTNFGVDDWDILETPDWIGDGDIEVDDRYIEQYGILVLYIKANALPAGEKGRSGEVVLGTQFNKEVVIKVKQGDVEDGIATVTTTKNTSNAATYNLAGQKVGKNFKGIVIKNGVKRIQK